MFPAAAFDETEWDGTRSGSWTVMGRLRSRQRICGIEASAARKRQREVAGSFSMMTAALGRQQYEDDLKARWRGGPSVLAFVFAQPDSAAVNSLDKRGDYLNIRSGDSWDLFFPGYYESDNARLEAELRSQPVGTTFAANWYFNAMAFDVLRHHVERATSSLWRYSGEADLVLVNVWLPELGDPVIDWESTQSWRLAPSFAHQDRPNLSTVVKSISADLEHDEGDASYGLTIASEDDPTPEDSTAKKIVIGTLSGIAAALAKRGLGL